MKQKQFDDFSFKALQESEQSLEETTIKEEVKQE